MATILCRLSVPLLLIISTVAAVAVTTVVALQPVDKQQQQQQQRVPTIGAPPTIIAEHQPAAIPLHPGAPWDHEHENRTELRRRLAAEVGQNDFAQIICVGDHWDGCWSTTSCNFTKYPQNTCLVSAGGGTVSVQCLIDMVEFNLFPGSTGCTGLGSYQLGFANRCERIPGSGKHDIPMGHVETYCPPPMRP